MVDYIHVSVCEAMGSMQYLPTDWAPKFSPEMLAYSPDGSIRSTRSMSSILDVFLVFLFPGDGQEVG